MPDSEALRSLVLRVGKFYITDKAMKRAHERMVDLIAREADEEGDRQTYAAAVRRYFTGFEAEARGHLRNVDRRLEQVDQVRFNLAAERGVTARRIESTREVLEELDRISES
ncbi:MAG: hypothetical protein ACYDG0_06110 [Vulcanimicrobiaceae bacterium]